MHANRETPIYVIGNARHGKTTVARLLAAVLDCSYADSSLFMADRVVRPFMEEHYGITYGSAEEAHRERGPHRAKWKEAITEFNADDPSKLSSEIFKENRIYCGCRSLEEFEAGKEKHQAFGLYVDAFERLGTREETFTIPSGNADIVLDNSGAWCDTVNRLLTIVSSNNLDGSHQTAGRRGVGVLPPTIDGGYDQ